MVLVVLVGVLLASHADVFGLLIAVVLVVVVRPIAVRLALIGAPTSAAQVRLIGWFGIRGIGSLYYLAYALEHGLAGPAAYAVSNIVVTTVATSIVAHGVSAHFLLPAAGSRTAS